MSTIERMARAAENMVLNPHQHGCSVSIVGNPARFYDAIARAMLTAMREPTEDMVRAGCFDGDAPYALGTWQTMIDVAMAEGA
jgi:hypothetical protein